MAQRKQFLLRLPPELHDALKRWADDELRSLNGQLEFLLRDALKQRGRMKDDDASADEPKKRGAGGRGGDGE